MGFRVTLLPNTKMQVINFLYRTDRVLFVIPENIKFGSRNHVTLLPSSRSRGHVIS